MDVAPVGRAALRRARRPGRRHDLALPLRQVRLDHPVVAALRVAAAADRLAAVPLRHPARPRRAHRRPGHPRVVDRGGRRQRGALPLQRAALRRHRRRLHPGRHPHPRLPPPHHRAGLHGHHQERQAHVRRAGRRHRARPVDDAGQRRRRARGAQLPRDRLAVVPVALPASSPTSTAMAAAPVQFHLHALVGMLLFALWPFTRLVHAFTAPLHYLFRPYIVYRSRDRPDARLRGRPAAAGAPSAPATATAADRRPTRSRHEPDRGQPRRTSTCRARRKNLALATLAFAITLLGLEPHRPARGALHRSSSGLEQQPEGPARRHPRARRLARAGSSPAR